MVVYGNLLGLVDSKSMQMVLLFVAVCWTEYGEKECLCSRVVFLCGLLCVVCI